MLNPSHSISQKPLPPYAPDFLIIGAQKAGTTALFHYLKMHPNIKASNPKEIHFFNCDNRFARGYDFYHSFFPQKTSGTDKTFEASGSYLAHGRAPERIFKYNPALKLIVLVRDPAERAFSAWNMYRKRYTMNRNWFFDEWVASCCNPDREFIKRNPDRLFNFSDYITDELRGIHTGKGTAMEAPVTPQGLYYLHLSKYLAWFRRDQILVIKSENFLKATRATLKKIELFLDIAAHDWDASNLAPVFEGQYSEVIDRGARKMLDDFYRQDSENLFNLLGEKPSWGPKGRTP